ncbi:hypothetical protein DITRI_Ditri20bG0096000 [Diplodiscus trichospermus]
MGRKEAQDFESFTKDIHGGQQHQTQAQEKRFLISSTPIHPSFYSSNGASAAGKINKAGTLIHHGSFRGRKRHGEARRKKRGGSRRIKGIGKTNKMFSIQKREKKKKKRLRNEVKRKEAYVLEVRSQLSRAKRGLVEGEATVEELKALIAQKREENNMHLMMNLWLHLLADQIELNIFP